MAEGMIAAQQFAALQPVRMVLECYLKWLGRYPVLAKAITR